MSSGIDTLRYPLVVDLAVEPVFAVFLLFLLAPLVPFFAFFPPVAHHLS
jgi:hypothetical protein